MHDARCMMHDACPRPSRVSRLSVSCLSLPGILETGHDAVGTRPYRRREGDARAQNTAREVAEAQVHRGARLSAIP